MMECAQCELFRRDEKGRISFSCDPFTNVKEPECLLKWQLIKINQMVEAYQATLRYYHKLAPMQDKLLKAMERELDDLNEAEKWKSPEQEEQDEPDKEENQDETAW